MESASPAGKSSGSCRRLALVCSNDTQATMFAAVAHELEARGARPVLLSLDPFYGQRATPAAESADVRVLEPRWTRPVPARGFHRRPPPAVWKDALAARKPLRGVLAHMRPARVAFGNDTGMIEKALMAESRMLGVPRRVLVQDGRLAEERPRAPGASGAASRLARRALSPLLLAAGQGQLATSEYGESGAEIICATGPRGAHLLRRRAGGASRVVVTGQPRYDRLRGRRRERSEGPISTVAIFTTPFSSAGFGSAVQATQVAAVASLHEALTREGIRVVVKPHPRESLEQYGFARPDVAEGDPADLLAVADVAVAGASTVIEEAAILGCPVLVLGSIVHPPAFRSLLPDPSVFPRFDSVAEGVRLIQRQSDPARRGRLLEVQQGVVLAEVLFSPDASAAANVADAILAP